MPHLVYGNTGLPVYQAGTLTLELGGGVGSWISLCDSGWPKGTLASDSCKYRSYCVFTVFQDEPLSTKMFY